MGSVIAFPGKRRHARAPSTSTTSGRGTSEGHATPSGHCAENQRITSSYLRAVKVLSPSARKKRQSPAAKRPNVDKLTLRAEAYADAQAMRFERSSDSMAEDHSRKIPTSQAISVGNFRLAENSDTSDKSAMSSVDEVRNRIRQAFDRSGESPITIALEWELGRDYLRDFLDGRKDSLKPEVLLALSERYSIPFNHLIIKRQRKKRKAA